MATKTIINHRKHNLKAAGVMLRPGENVLDEEKARKFVKHEQAQLWHKLGWIGVKRAAGAADLGGQLSEGAEGADDDTETSPPGPMSAKDAIAAVMAEEDAAVLEGMIDGEDRVTVLKAIESRLDALSEAADDKADASGDSDGGEG